MARPLHFPKRLMFEGNHYTRVTSKRIPQPCYPFNPRNPKKVTHWNCFVVRGLQTYTFFGSVTIDRAHEIANEQSQRGEQTGIFRQRDRKLIDIYWRGQRYHRLKE